MSDLRRFCCWSSEEALDVVGTEAVHASRAVFLATHAPLRIRKRSLTKSAAAGTRVAERDVLQDLLRRNPAGGVLLMPVIGESGTGKSHLVRWVKENLPPKTSHKIVYLKKTHTNLSAVVHELLAGLDGPLFDEIRRDIDQVTTDLDETSLAHQLLDSLAFSITFGARDDGQDESPLRLAGEHGLPALLRDVHFRAHFLRPGSLVPALASHLVEGRKEDQQDRALEFVISDLPLDMEHTDRASQVARDMWTRLKGDPALQTSALDLLNQNVDAAVLRASNLGVGRLQKAMLEIRKQLLRTEQELVLLVEDFALVQGVQRDLLDAITETSVREGEKVLAPVRTLMAVTSGYYKRIADTVRTRASAGTPYVYDLDVRFGSDVTDDDVQDFVGRYLNAARLGVRILESVGQSASPEVPNACEKCPVQTECHDGFGADSNDVGLYPFNRAALVRAIRARAPESASDTFNARSVLGEVVRHVLVYERDAIQEGRFPSEEFHETYQPAPDVRTLDSEIAAQVRRIDPTDAQRREILLEFWGDAPTSLINLPDPVHRAFDLPPLPAEALGDVPDAEQTERPRPVAPASRDIPERLQAQLDVVEAWSSRKKKLTEDVAGVIRNVVRQAVIRRTHWFDPITHEPSVDDLKSAWPVGAATVSIEGAATEARAKSTRPPVRFERSAENAVFFKALLRINAGYGASTGAHQRRLAQLADWYSGQLRADVRRTTHVGDETVLTGIRASLLGAVLAGKITPAAPLSDMVGVVLDPGRGWSRADESTRLEKWHATLDAHLTKREQLTSTLAREFAVSQGPRGRPRMVDAARLLPFVERAARRWSWPESDTALPAWIAHATTHFADLPGLLQAQHSSLRSLLTEIRTLMPAGDTPTLLIERLQEALTSAVDAGLASSIKDIGAETRDLDRAGEFDWKVVSTLERDLRRYSDSDDADNPGDWTAILQLTGMDRGADLSLLHGFLQRAEQWVQASLSGARQVVNPDADAVVADLQTTLEEWKHITQEATTSVTT